MKDVRVRFAPSPTGFLHVGGARTAIFNWLFAKSKGGKFLVRIEDTDPERSKSELSAQILRSMGWLEMNSDEPVVYQSDNLVRYREIVNKLIESGKAYYAFETASELDEKRKEAQAKKIPFKYDRSALNLSREQVTALLNEGKERTVRFLVPEGITEFEDIVHGKTVFNNSEIDDFVIQRSDGSPIYQIAVVVDDNDMGITHVIRGDDHLSNTPKQILLYKALGWDVPQFAHLPMILDEQKKKLSKRRDTVAVEEYKEMGYLPEALFNFLTLLGFAPSGTTHSTPPQPSPKNTVSGAEPGRVNETEVSQTERELVSRDELVKQFTFDRVNKKSAVFDIKKLQWMNSEYIKSADEIRIAELLKEKLIEKKIVPSGDIHDLNVEYLVKVIRLMKERVSTINDFAEFGRYFFAAPETYDEKGLAKYWTEEIKPLFNEFALVIQGYEVSQWNSFSLEESLRKFAEEKGIKAASIIHPLRLALTGITISPGIFEVMETLGKDNVNKRLARFTENHT